MVDLRPATVFPWISFALSTILLTTGSAAALALAKGWTSQGVTSRSLGAYHEPGVVLLRRTFSR